MYYHSAVASVAARSWTATGSVGLPLTPVVALRNLFEQLRSYEAISAQGNRLDVYSHFPGPILPPARHMTRPMGDPVLDAIAQYASWVASRAGLLTTRNQLDERHRLNEYGRLTRHLFTTEHALAVDLERVAPDLSLRDREKAARAVLALAAFWCDRCELIDLDSPSAHPLLGILPSDRVGKVLYDHAKDALRPAKKKVTGAPKKGRNGEVVIDLTIGLMPSSD